MEDINGKIITVGATVKTQQPSGGILPPAKPSIGVVIECDWEEYHCNGELMIQFREEGRSTDSFILLSGKINEIV